MEDRAVAAERRYGRQARALVDGLRARAGSAYDRWDALRCARGPGLAAGPDEALALREFWCAQAEVRGAERLALTLGLDVDQAPPPATG